MKSAPPDRRAANEAGRPVRCGDQAPCQGSDQSGTIYGSKEPLPCRRGATVLECGDWSPLLRRRLVAVENRHSSAHAGALTLARAANAPSPPHASRSLTATSRLKKAVTSHRTPHPPDQTQPMPGQVPFACPDYPGRHLCLCGEFAPAPTSAPPMQRNHITKTNPNLGNRPAWTFQPRQAAAFFPRTAPVRSQPCPAFSLGGRGLANAGSWTSASAAPEVSHV